MSPSLTVIACNSPLSNTLPGPTDITSPCEGFSAAEPGSTIPPSEVCSSSVRLTNAVSQWSKFHQLSPIFL